VVSASRPEAGAIRRRRQDLQRTICSRFRCNTGGNTEASVEISAEVVRSSRVPYLTYDYRKAN
jgi:hypothetical protein